MWNRGVETKSDNVKINVEIEQMFIVINKFRLYENCRIQNVCLVAKHLVFWNVILINELL